MKCPKTKTLLTVSVLVITLSFFSGCAKQVPIDQVPIDLDYIVFLPLSGEVMSESAAEISPDLIIGVCNFGESESASRTCRNEIWGYDEEKKLMFVVKSSELYGYQAPVFSPDGRFIAYIRLAPIELGIGSPGLDEIQNKGSTDIWVLDLDTKKEYQLTDSRWSINMVSDKVFQNWFYFTPQLEWSADGRFIHAIYHGQNPDGKYIAEHLIINVLDRKTSQLFSSDYNSDAFFLHGLIMVITIFILIQVGIIVVL